LVVDDESAIRDILEQAFSRTGYKVYSAESAEEAFEVLKKKKIRVVFLDLNLPGMSGVELAKQIREYWPMTIINAITGYVSFFELADCRKAGFDDYFPKPMNLEILIKAAQDAFEKIDRWKSHK